MNDFIKINSVNDIPNYQDFQLLSKLAAEINLASNVEQKYIGMHLSERVLYLTYYINIKRFCSHVNNYKIDIRIEKGEDGNPTGDFDVCFKRQSNAPIRQNEYDNIKNSTILNMFNMDQACFVQNENFISLGNYNSEDLYENMKKLFEQLRSEGGKVV